MKNKLEGIELLRFFAALSVVFYHIPVIRVGSFGVDIFFVISGFVMMLSTANNTNNFFLKRAIRIVPLYWLVTFGVFLIAILFPHLLRSTDTNLIHLLKSLFFIPFDKNGISHQPVVAVGWTLNFEMYFYFLFWLACLISKSFRGVITVLFLIFIISIMKQFDGILPQIYSNIIILEFALGICLFYLMNKNYYCVLFVASLIVISSYLNFNISHRFFIYGIPSLFIVWMSIILGKYLPKSSYYVMLGSISYPLYLIHAYVIRFFDRIFDWFNNDLIYLNVLAIIISLFGSILLAYILYKFFEKPLLKKLHMSLIK